MPSPASVVCFNPQQAKRDAEARQAILHHLKATLAHGDKALVGNAGYRRSQDPHAEHFVVDPARVAEDARFDGLYVLRTNSPLNALSVALAYRQLWRVEAIFRTAKAILETRPINHQSDEAIAGHLFCPFLALVFKKLDERLAAVVQQLPAATPPPAPAAPPKPRLGRLRRGATRP